MNRTHSASKNAPTSQFDDPRRPLLRALRLGGVALIVITIASLALWGGMRGLPGIYGVLIGAAVGGGFVLLTVVSVLVTHNTSPTTTGAVVLGGWLLKLIVLFLILLFLRDLDFYDHVAMFVTVVLVLVAVLGCEAWGIVTSNVTYVQPSEAADASPSLSDAASGKPASDAAYEATHGRAMHPDAER